MQKNWKKIKKRKETNTGQIENKQQDISFKPNHISQHIKCKWSKHLQVKSSDCQIKKKKNQDPEEIPFKDTNRYKIKNGK